MSKAAHKHAASLAQNQKAQLATAYNELGKELSSNKIKVVGNYTLGKVIGEGAYGKVRLGTHRLTSTRVAVKQIPKGLSAQLTREIHHHRQLHHPHITQLYEVIATEGSIWLVTELCSGGELFDYLTEKGRLGEEETRRVFGQICLAVNYLHEKGIVHRDLKLENVLLDERCRVKLGDFGFTREFDRGAYLETYCGTTGYAAPEMLEGKKYLGPEVDVWSLGVIFYCLLTGGLPFDDDDESVMRAMVIKGEFDDPEWLSDDVRDLIRKVLQKDPTKRATIPQILAHPWFTSASSPVGPVPSSHVDATPQPIQTQPSAAPSESSATSESSFRSASSELDASSATTPDDISHESMSDENPHIHRHPSQSTIRKSVKVDTKMQPHPETVMEEELPPPLSRQSSAPRSPAVKGPPALPTRTPVRTKRRSVSSNLSDPSSPTHENPATPLPPQDFASLLNAPAPIIFGTELERDLLNSLSSLGFDTGQIVHSVLSDACDAASAIWWMLRRHAERKAVGDGISARRLQVRESREANSELHGATERKHSSRQATNDPDTPSTVRAEPPPLLSARSAPELAFIPATPTSMSHSRAGTKTPPRAGSPSHPFLSPSSSAAESQSKSNPSTPGGSSKEKEKDKKDGSKGRREGKMRSGSVSIMQRATTALEAAGLVRKKSAETVKDDKSKEKEKEGDKRFATGEEPRHSHGSGKLAKAPPPRDTPAPGTPTPDHEVVANPAVPSSPWVMTAISNPPSREHSPTPSPGDTLTSLPRISPKETGHHRNRASLLSAFRMWFNEDRKGKRKSGANSSMSPHSVPYAHGIDQRTQSSSGFGRSSVKVKRRTSGSGATSRKGHRAKGHSISSHRSSSVNSRRSSTTSMAQIVMDSPQFTLEHMVTMSRQRSDPSRRSFGSRTPNSERGEYVSSRPSSVHSYTVGKHRHRKSPSASSAGSLHLARTTSPYHRRAGSGSSTRVVRSPAQGPSRPPHIRTNSTTSSIHSLPSSRPGSFYEQSESEAQRTGSPFRPRSRNTLEEAPRRGNGHSYGNATFVAQKRQTPFQPPASIGSGSAMSRSSWKRSWGLEPPGWQTRTALLPVEVLSISPVGDVPVLRDVFTGRPSLSPDDDDEWVDVDDEPAYVGGLGQTPATATSFFSASSGASPIDPTFGGYPVENPIILSSAPRGPGIGRAQKGKRAGKGPSGRTKPGTPPIGRISPLPSEANLEAVPEARSGRRQLPNTRPGPAFRHPIQEEDEDEGEE
ncbi:hypothetical protein BC834DRAFT_874237 [Gloeopeniophorella convolvens]|nr:hypothetical protein BC834DRAFT_874237 [Gloeopeniophorella convolvens]